MWTALASLLLGIMKWVFEKQAKKKLNDAEFLEHIEFHQKKRQNAGKTAIDFDIAMAEAEERNNKEN